MSKGFLIVQSELYLGPQRQSGAYAKMLRGQPDAVVFDSYYDQYLYAPLHVTAGQHEMLDHHLDHATAGAAGYIDAGAPGR